MMLITLIQVAALVTQGKQCCGNYANRKVLPGKNFNAFYSENLIKLNWKYTDVKTDGFCTIYITCRL